MADVTLDARLDIAVAEKLSEEWRALLLQEKSITFHAGDVAYIATPVIQLMIALDKTLTKNGGDIRFDAVTDQMKEIFNQFGLEQWLSKRVISE